jgi:hypothetical protein
MSYPHPPLSGGGGRGEERGLREIYNYLHIPFTIPTPNLFEIGRGGVLGRRENIYAQVNINFRAIVDSTVKES